MTRQLNAYLQNAMLNRDMMVTTAKEKNKMTKDSFGKSYHTILGYKQ